ncbi:MAG: hypothetical protein IPP90_13255 [Gemmatimonadaceae bacterium]|nr:hypothetical protein [Gemmatimonadaceae bacterium]
MLRESSITTAKTLRCGTAEAITSPGRNRQPSTSSTASVRSVPSTTRSRTDSERTRVKERDQQQRARRRQGNDEHRDNGCQRKSPRANTRSGT